MRLAAAVWGLLLLVVGSRCADFLQRIRSPDFVAVSFSEGGDDAYYFFTIARNLAAGLGITIDRIQWTTGFQPLWGLLCAPPFALAADRWALGIIYAFSLALWLASAVLFVRFVRRASATEASAPAIAVIATLFLCEAQFSSTYFNGMETGLYLTLLLWLLVEFQRYLQAPAGQVTARQVAGVGVVAGLTMLARNDGFFLCGALLAAALFAGRRRRPLRDCATVVAIASVMVVPWLVYCQWVTGNPLPQSGLATSVALRGHPALESILRKIVLSIEPLGFLKMRTLADDHFVTTAAAVSLAAAALAVCWRRARPAMVDRASGLVLFAFTAADACLLAYYIGFSAAGQFFERYFAPLKLLVFLLLALLLVRALARAGRSHAASAALAAAALTTVGSNLYWIWRDYGMPWRSHLGREAYEIVRSPYAGDGSRIGLAESGRLGFLYPERVVNLDGKVNVDALHALLAGRLDRYIRSADLDYVMLHDEDIAFFDTRYPSWRDAFRPSGTLGEFQVFKKVSRP